jgi:hypothetical protein
MDEPSSAEALRKSITARFAVRVHCALILCACFGVGLLVTKLMLIVGVQAMWLRYAVALVAAYLMFLLGVRIWLFYAGFERPILPSRRSSLADNLDLANFGGSGGGGSSGGGIGSIFRGGGGRSGGGGASLAFGDGGRVDPAPTSAFLSSSSHGGSGGGLDLDFGDDGWVIVAFIALLLAVSGSVVWLIYAAPTILADAAFAALLSAGLVKSTKHIASGGWVESVVGHTWIAFTVVFALALTFALVAQHRFPDAHTIVDVVRHL